MYYGPVPKVQRNHRSLMSEDTRLPRIKKLWMACDDIAMHVDYLKYYPDKLCQSNRNPKACYHAYKKPYKGGSFHCPYTPNIKCYQNQVFSHSALPLNMLGRYKRTTVRFKKESD